MMYVAGATEYRNRAICISPANAHTWDHVRLSFCLKEFPKLRLSFVSPKGVSDPASWARHWHQPSEIQRIQVKTQRCQALDLN